MRLALRLLLAALALIGLGFGWRVWTQHVYRARLQEVAALAVGPEPLQRPWEPRLEALSVRLRGQPGFPPEGPRPLEAWLQGPRELEPEQRRWLEEAEAALAGLDGILANLRALEPDQMTWNGEAPRLQFLRECTHVLVGRAWRAADPGQAAAHLADALRLARATDEGTVLGSVLRLTSEQIVLDCARAGLAGGRFEARTLQAVFAPLLADWIHDPVRAERRVRRDLAALKEVDLDRALSENGGWLGRPARQRETLRFLAPLEQALEIARLPVASTPWVVDGGANASLLDSARPTPLSQWCLGTYYSHGRHARRNVFLTGLAVAAFHETSGRWPAHLEQVTELAPEDALDPLTGEPLDYVASPEGALVGPAQWGRVADRGPNPVRSPYAWDLGAR